MNLTPCSALCAINSVQPALCREHSAAGTLQRALCSGLSAADSLQRTLCSELSAGSSVQPALCRALCSELPAASSRQRALGSELAAASSLRKSSKPCKAAEQKKKLHRLTRAYWIYGARSRELAAESSLRNPLSPGKAMELFFLSPEPYQGLMDFRPRCRARRNFIIFLMKIFFPDTKTYGSEQNIIKINEFR